MSFWKFLGFAALVEFFFGERKKKPDNPTIPYNLSPREYVFDDEYERLSTRIDELEGRLEEVDYDSELYDDIQNELDVLNDELDDLDDERIDYDDY